MGKPVSRWHEAGKGRKLPNTFDGHVFVPASGLFFGRETLPIRNFYSLCAMLNWMITLLLLAMVAGFFVFAGTAGVIGSLLAHITVVGCSAVAVVMLGFHIWHRSRHSKAN
jgi:hypothetical protein